MELAHYSTNLLEHYDDVKINLAVDWLISHAWLRLASQHFHLLIWPSEVANPSQLLQRLEDRTALFILKNLCRNLGFAWCQRTLKALKRPPSVHHHAHHRMWQRGNYDEKAE